MTQHDEQVTTASSADAHTSAHAHERRPVRQLLAASVGNAVEWYDWYCRPFASGLRRSPDGLHLGP